MRLASGIREGPCAIAGPFGAGGTDEVSCPLRSDVPGPYGVEEIP